MASYQKLWDVASVTFKFSPNAYIKKREHIPLIYKDPYKYRYGLAGEL